MRCEMEFTKMQGIGNDYVYVDCFKEKVEHPGEVSKYVSDRHFGIGSDGLILICPSDKADCRMDMYNADGSRGEMCGNGIRCVAKYVYDNGMTDKEVITVETLSGIKTLQLAVFVLRLMIQDTGNHTCAGTGSAGKGLSGSSLPYPHINGFFINHMNEFRIDTIRKNLMVFK